jgi:hypothetical protein
MATCIFRESDQSQTKAYAGKTCKLKNFHNSSRLPESVVLIGSNEVAVEGEMIAATNSP